MVQTLEAFWQIAVLLWELKPAARATSLPKIKSEASSSSATLTVFKTLTSGVNEEKGLEKKKKKTGRGRRIKKHFLLSSLEKLALLGVLIEACG